MTLPGVTFRVIASRLCSAQTMERVSDQVRAETPPAERVADSQIHQP